MRIFAVETSCDETSLAVLDASGANIKIVKHLVASQADVHREFGGVVPNLAKREHIRNLPVLLGKIAQIPNFQCPTSNKFPISQFPKLKKFFNRIDLIAVTVGPGLEPALWAGINFAKSIARATGKPIVGVNHLEGHLYSFLLQKKTAISKSKFPVSKKGNRNLEIKDLRLEFPAIALIVSGGHTVLLLMKSPFHYRKIGETRDDAAGEAFDKVARLLRLPYPGGPEIEKLARHGRHDAVVFPRPMLNQKNYSFSFSGLKTAVLYYLRDHAEDFSREDVAASFERAAFDVLAGKTARAALEYRARSVLLSGGVAANTSLRKAMRVALSSLPGAPKLIVTPKRFCTDNAAIIATAAYINHLRKIKRRLTASGNLSL